MVKPKLVRAENEFGAGDLFFGGITDSDIYMYWYLPQKHIKLKARSLLRTCECFEIDRMWFAHVAWWCGGEAWW